MRVLLLNMVKLISVCKENRTSFLALSSRRAAPARRIQHGVYSILTEQNVFTSRLLEEGQDSQVNRTNSETCSRQQVFAFCIDSY